MLAMGCYHGANVDSGPDTDTDASASASASMGDSASASGEPTTGSPEDLPEEAVVAGPTGLRLLTLTQYRNSVIDALGPVSAPAVGQWRSSIAAAQGGVAAATVEDYEGAALTVTAELFADPDARLLITGCSPSVSVDDPCVGQVIRDIGRRAWRRPLDTTEVTRYAEVAAEVAVLLDGDPWLGLQHAIAGLLQSPYFLYRVELGHPVAPDDPLHVRLDGYELASRLSYLVWNTSPDEALLQAAATGELDDPAALSAQLDRMFASPRARDGIIQLFVDMLDLDVLLSLQKNPELLPAFTPTLGVAMREELVRVIEDVVLVQGDYRQLFETRTGFVDAELAALYEVPGEFDGSFVPVTLPETRKGLLTLAGFLAINSGEASTSPTLRGLAIRRMLMCQTIPPPPPDVEPELPEPGDDTPMTKREQLDAHVSNPVCAACHQFTDPVGLALEHYDAIGGYRATDRGLPIDPSGVLDEEFFADAIDLSSLFAKHPAVHECVIRNLYRYATGHIEDHKLQPVIVRLREALIDQGYDLTAAVEALVRDEGFRYATRSPEDLP